MKQMPRPMASAATTQFWAARATSTVARMKCSVMPSTEGAALGFARELGAVEVGAENQKGPGGSHVGLASGELGELAAPGGVAHPDDRDGLDVARGGRGLAAADDLADLVVRDGLGREFADRAVGQEEALDVVHGELQVSSMARRGHSLDTCPMRIATPEDIPELVRVINAAYQAEAFCIKGDRTHAEEVRSLMAAGTFLVLDRPGGLKGSVFLRRDVDARWYLGLLSVDPACQGLGLGRALVEAAEAYCRCEGGKFLDLTVVSARKELFGFYLRLGYAANDVLPFRAPEKLKVPCHLVRFTRCLIPPAEL